MWCLNASSWYEPSSHNLRPASHFTVSDILYHAVTEFQETCRIFFFRFSLIRFGLQSFFCLYLVRIQDALKWQLGISKNECLCMQKIRIVERRDTYIIVTAVTPCCKRVGGRRVARSLLQTSHGHVWFPWTIDTAALYFSQGNASLF